jgi:hypothetical protein
MELKRLIGCHFVTVNFMRVTFEDEACLHFIEEFSPCLKENTTLHHYKDPLINAV